MKLNTSCVLKMAHHGAKYPQLPCIGALLGSSESISQVIPLFHSLICPTFEIAIQQVILILIL